MNFKKVNNIAGWVVCAIASLVYILTAEKAGSLWDCGEFVSACFKVQLPHPPGAPLFVLLGRFFIILFGDNGMTAAKAVNIMNALASGLTILFLFWTITHFARKLMVGFKEEPTGGQTLTIIGAGVIGGLAYTFSDSFWFSAVEGEVYALSSFFTALAFWAILKWERADDAAGDNRALRNRADRWIVFLFFSLGLSIGIHLLGLLVIPAAVMVYYFKRYPYTRWGAIWAFIIGCVIVGVVQVAVIQYTVKIAGRFDILFVNSFGLPFFSGFAFFFIAIAALVWWGLRVANRKGWSFLRLGLWCFSFMMLGYSTYVTTLERSNANPSLDMNNVDNPMSLVYYLGREQYGSQPILYGTHFLAQPTDLVEKSPRFVKGPTNYVELAPDKEYAYDSKDYQLFPRVWDPSNDQGHADYYIQWLNLDAVYAREPSMVTGVGEGVVQTQNQQGKPDTYTFPDNYAPRVQRGQVVQANQPLAIKIPTYGNNIEWFFTYQMGFMYWRYFMWNFAGKQNDIQGGGNKRDGNWISGLSFVDNTRLGDQSRMPESIQHNKAHNTLFLLPFILGIIGCVYHFIKDRKDWIVTFLLFFFTGIAIVIYLNQAGNQPRERDYAFAGSFYAYAIWIGLAVVALVRMAKEIQDKLTFKNVMVYGSIATFVIGLMSNIPGNFNAVIGSSIFMTALFAVITALLTYAVRFAGKTNLRNAGIVATALCLIAPVIMGAQEWDDHDRSQKTLAPDIAKDYLNSCPKNAVLFTFGDNDTYPLWYAQEVEGVRPDIRIINTSLLGIDWYVNQLRYKVNESAPVDVIWTEDQIRGLSYVTFEGQGDQAKTEDLKHVMKDILGQQKPIPTNFPARHLTVPVDVNAVRADSLVKMTDSVGSSIQIDIPENKNYLSLDQLTMLNILASTNWKRPICFTSYYNEIGFGPYLRQEGLIYHLVPVKSEATRGMDVDRTANLLQNEFRSGGANLKGVYFDEENRRHLLSIRQTYAFAASSLADAGRKQEAVNLLRKCESLISTDNLPYAMASRGNTHDQLSMLYLEAAYKAGDMDLANKLKTALRKDLKDQKAYYDYMKNTHEEYYPAFISDEQDCDRFLGFMDQWEKMYDPTKANANPIVNEKPGQQRTDSSK